MIRLLFLLSVFTFFAFEGKAKSGVVEDSLKTEVCQKDLLDLFSSNPKLKTDSVERLKLYMPVLPLVGYMPANGFIVGVAALPSMLLDSSQFTRISSVMANIQFTSKKQVNLNVRSNVYLSHDKWILQGDWRMLFYSQPTYGFGIYKNPSNLLLDGRSVDIDNNGQPMRFNYARVYQRLYRHIWDKLYLGGGVAYDGYFAIRDEALNLDPNAPIFTSHYLYSRYKGYDLGQYHNTGVTLNALYDNRDNSMNTYRGFYVDMTYRLNPNYFNANHANSKFLYDFRTYITLLARKNPHLLAVWLWGDFKLKGDAPYLTLPSIGWDTYNRSGRGYVQGRFRGENLVYGEVEYRFPITNNGVLGGVTFLNSTTASSESTHQRVFDVMVFGYGSGVRIKVNRPTRVNLCIDYAHVINQKGTLFFGLQEVF